MITKYKSTMVNMALICVLGLTFSSGAFSDESSKQIVKEEVAKLLPSHIAREIGRIYLSEVTGWYEVEIGADVLYASKDGRYLLVGEVYDLSTKINLTEQQRSRLRLGLIAELENQDLIIFPAKQEQHVVYVFTDIECQFCRLLHSKVAEFNQLGITLKYLAFPRKGVDSNGYRLLHDVWCSKDRSLALTQAKREKTIPAALANCKSPVAQHYQLGNKIGVRGTPFLVDNQGRKYTGYTEPKELKSFLDK